MAKSKFFRVATEGATTDGRTIQRTWIEQMAKNYDPKKYGARINMEHIRGFSPEKPFNAWGDVVALKAEAVEDGKLGLFAQLEPTDDLVAINQKRQKVYTSIEVDDSFADTGEAYLVGLALTDSPASLGCDYLQFCAGKGAESPLASRKLKPSNVFSAGFETKIEMEPDPILAPAAEASMAAFVGNLIAGAFQRIAPPAAPATPAAATPSPAAAGPDLSAFAGELKTTLEAFAGKVDQSLAAERASREQLATQVQEMATKLDHTAEPGKQRPPATGGAGGVLTDC